jgi:hypothetical protein
LNMMFVRYAIFILSCFPHESWITCNFYLEFLLIQNFVIL